MFTLSFSQTKPILTLSQIVYYQCGREEGPISSALGLGQDRDINIEVDLRKSRVWILI